MKKLALSAFVILISISSVVIAQDAVPIQAMNERYFH